MKLLGKYIGSTVTWMILFTCAVLLGILSLFTLLDEMTKLENNYQLAEALGFLAYTTPGRLYGLVPYGILIGCLAGLGTLANNSELIVMRSSGVSTYQISLNVFKPLLIILLLNVYLGEYIVPDTERMARNNKQRAISDANKILPRFGYWYREGNIYMHFDWLNSGGVLEGISHYVFDDQRKLVRILFAKRGVFHKRSEHHSYWLLEDIDITELKENKSSTDHLTSFEWETSVRPDLLANEVLVQPDNLSIKELSNKIDYLKHQGLSASRYELGFWQKVLQPVSTIGLVLIAISFIFGPLRQSTMGVRVVSGIVAGLLFKFVQDMMAPASLVFNFPPLLAVVLPVLLCFALGLVLFRRAA